MKTILKITLGIVLASVLLVGGCAVLIGGAATEVSKEIDREQNRSAITNEQAKAVPMGTSLSAVKQQLGEPRDTQEMESEGFDGGTNRSDCIYYNIKGGELLDAWQFCFDNDKLTSRNRM